MKIQCISIALLFITAVAGISFKQSGRNTYITQYFDNLEGLSDAQVSLVSDINSHTLQTEADIQTIRQHILNTRRSLKSMDFWCRYLEPTVYKQMNGPLPVEWETEVFEKFEKPYKRKGAGLTLALLYLDEEHPDKDTLLQLVQASISAENTYRADSITRNLNGYHHFYLCNRLYLLNLATIYTTGFECPDTAAIIPELRQMMADVNIIYKAFNESFPTTALNNDFMALYAKALSFAENQNSGYSAFNHFTFIRDYVNPLYAMNQKMIQQYQVVSKSLIDYSLNKDATSIFQKNLYNGQNPKGIFLRVDDAAALSEIEQLGRLLFYDPILSGNNQRSCASCHKTGQYFADTAVRTAMQYNKEGVLPRNTPSLINAEYNHLIMLDGVHYTLQHQIKAVVANPIEMGSSEQEVMTKILSCKDYEKRFKNLLQYTPQEKDITFDHIASVISWYYSRFSTTYAPFDEAMTDRKPLNPDAIRGFNIFMSKAQCATCHFAPQFNGVKPPYIGSEFEVLGVPADTGFQHLSPDKGRYGVNPATETLNAFRTGTIRNAAYTMPYMHNGVFSNLSQVIDFYNNGGGTGRGLTVENQTLPGEKLGLTDKDKQQLIAFIMALTEPIPAATPPAKLPPSRNKILNTRTIGGTY